MIKKIGTEESKASTKKVVAKKATSKKKVVTKKTVSKKQVAAKTPAKAEAPVVNQAPVVKKAPAAKKKAATVKKKAANKPAQKIELSPRERYEMIATMAYYRAEKRNFAPGNDEQDWFECEQLIDEMLRKK